MTIVSPVTTPSPTESVRESRRPSGMRLGRLVLTELRLVLREPVVLTFVLAFPVITVAVLGGVFDPDDPAFEGIDPAHYFAASYIGVVMAAIGLIMLPVHIAGYRERGVTRRFRVSSFPGWALPLAHMAIGLLMTVVGVAVLLTTAGLTYGVPAVDDPVLTAVGVVAGALTFSSIGVALGSLMPTARSAQGLGMLLFFPSFLLGGGGPPPDAMGDGMRAVSDFVPLTHVIRAIQEPWLAIGTPGDHLLVVAGLGVVATGTWMVASVRGSG